MDGIDSGMRLRVIWRPREDDDRDAVTRAVARLGDHNIDDLEHCDSDQAFPLGETSSPRTLTPSKDRGRLTDLLALQSGIATQGRWSVACTRPEYADDAKHRCHVPRERVDSRRDIAETPPSACSQARRSSPLRVAQNRRRRSTRQLTGGRYVGGRRRCDARREPCVRQQAERLSGNAMMSRPVM
jgi:hypothetical protein